MRRKRDGKMIQRKIPELVYFCRVKKGTATKCIRLHSLQMEATHSPCHLSFCRGIFALLLRESLGKHEECCREESAVRIPQTVYVRKQQKPTINGNPSCEVSYCSSREFNQSVLTHAAVLSRVSLITVTSVI